MSDLPINTIVHGDLLEVLAHWPAGCVDAVVTDPPYGLHFMGQEWDGFKANTGKRVLTDGLGGASGDAGAYDSRRNAEYGRFMQRVGRALFRVLKPGGHVLMFGAPRRHHWQGVALELAGFDVRDTLCWLFGEGFPKSHDVSKAIDRMHGAEREVIGENPHRKGRNPDGYHDGWARPWQHDPDARAMKLTAPATDDARRWQGWGTALKPGWEPVIVARKPLRGSVAANVLAHGTGALNVDGCRLPVAPGDEPQGGYGDGARPFERDAHGITHVSKEGRWPANVALDEGAAALLDAQAGDRGAFAPVRGTEPSAATNGITQGHRARVEGVFHGDTGGASRFFYCAKARRGEREAGLREAEQRGTLGNFPDDPGKSGALNVMNNHPTVKPLELMRWLVRLITPPDGVVLDPFAGSGTTLCAAAMEGVRWVGIEQAERYVAIARARTAWWADVAARGITDIDAALGLQREHDAERKAHTDAGQIDLLEDVR